MKKVILSLALATALLGCKKGDSYNYNYTEKENTISCTDSEVSDQLIKEAFYTFENAIQTKMQNKSGTKKVSLAYGFKSFISRAKNSTNVSSYITKDAVALAKELKKLNIWENGHLKYNSQLTECIFDNVDNKNIKETFDALLSVNSVEGRLMAATIYGAKGNKKYQDQALLTYVALDLYYSRLLDIDPTKINYLEAKEIKTPQRTKKSKKTEPAIGKQIKLNQDK